MDQERTTSITSPGRRRAILGVLAGMTGIALTGVETAEAKTDRKKIRKKHRKRCRKRRHASHTPLPEEECEICPQRYCCSCGDYCGFIPAADPDPSLTCQSLCAAGNHGVEEPLFPEQGFGNFCSKDNTCVAIACPVQ